MAYYHCLGGFYLNGSQIIKMNIELPFLEELQEPISIYRLYKILKDGEIKSKNRIIGHNDNYGDLEYDKDSIYLATVGDNKKGYTEAFYDWSGYNISLKIKDALKNDFELLSPYMFLPQNTIVRGEVRIKDSIPLSYVEAICIPIYNSNLWKSFFFSPPEEKLNKDILKVLNIRKTEVDFIHKILEMTNQKIPVIETFTETSIDISSIINELAKIEKEKRADYVMSKKNSLLKKYV